MEDPDFSQLSPEVMKLFLAEIEAMRDALVQLSLALSDYRFTVQSNNLLDAGLETKEMFSKIMAASKRSV